MDVRVLRTIRSLLPNGKQAKCFQGTNGLDSYKKTRLPRSLLIRL